MAGMFFFTRVSYGRFHALVAPAVYGMVHDGKVLIAAVMVNIMRDPLFLFLSNLNTVENDTSFSVV